MKDISKNLKIKSYTPKKKENNFKCKEKCGFSKKIKNSANNNEEKIINSQENKNIIQKKESSEYKIKPKHKLQKKVITKYNQKINPTNKK